MSESPVREPGRAGQRSARAPVVLAAAIPLASLAAVDPWGWFRYGPIKVLAIGAVTWSAAAMALWRGGASHRRAMRMWGAFLGWAAIVSTVGADPLSSWLGTPDRRLGVLGVATLAGAFLVGLRTPVSWLRVVPASIGLAALVSAAMGEIVPRLTGPYGSAAYTAAAMTLLAPVAFGGAVAAGSARGRVMWGGAASVAFGMLLLTGTRAGLIGAVVSGALVARRLVTAARRRKILAVALAAAAVVVVVVSPVGERVTRLAESGGAGRLDEWRIGAVAMAESPMLGYGLEGYRIVFPSVVDVAYAQRYGRSTITDRAHSAPLDVALWTGIPGAAAWMAAAIFLGRRAWRALHLADPLTVGVAAGVAGYLAQSVFLFPTLETDVMFWLFSGLLVAATGPLPRGRGRPLAATGVALVALAVAVTGVLDVAADRSAASMLADPGASSPPAPTDLRPDSFRYLLATAEARRRVGDLDGALQWVARAEALIDREPAVARARLELEAEAAGRDPSRVPRARNVAARYTIADSTDPEGWVILGSLAAVAGDAAEAERAWLRAEFLEPNNDTPTLLLAELYERLGMTDRAGAARSRLVSDPESGGD